MMDASLPARRAAAKVVGLVAFASAVVALPNDVVWPYGIGFVVALVFLARSGATWRWVLPRLSVEIPFAVFALLMPFVALGPRVAVGPLWLSVDGIWAGWSLLATATTSVLAALAFARSTPVEDLLAGLRLLRVPEPLTEIGMFFARYVSVTAGRWQAMSRSRAARGFSARTPAAWAPITQALGLLFLRSYEQGERVHRAMLARGYVAAAGLDGARRERST